MKLECKIKRVGGTDVHLPPFGPGDFVQFRPLDATRADSPHVAEVSAEQAQFLIALDPKVYTLFDAKAPRVTLQPPSPPPPPTYTAGAQLEAARSLPPVIDLGNGYTVPLGEIVQDAFKAAQMTPDQWNSLGENEREARINAQIEATRQRLAGGQDADTDGRPEGDANGDGALSVRELKALIAEDRVTDEQLRELLAEEEARPTPRSSFIGVIMQALKK